MVTESDKFAYDFSQAISVTNVTGMVDMTLSDKYSVYITSSTNVIPEYFQVKSCLHSKVLSFSK